MAKECPSCKTQNIEEAKFCRSCGAQVDFLSKVDFTPTNSIETTHGKSSSSGIVLILGILGIAAFLTFTSSDQSTKNNSTMQIETTPENQESLAHGENINEIEQKYIRPDTAPNGHAWPTSADYIAGYSLDNSDGRSSVTVDNTQNDSDIFVKLYWLNGGTVPVRHFFIPAHSSFSLENVNIGTYDVRYKDLSTGMKYRTEEFQLEEIDTGDGIQYSDLSLTIYKVQNGNMETYDIDESQF